MIFMHKLKISLIALCCVGGWLSVEAAGEKGVFFGGGGKAAKDNEYLDPAHLQPFVDTLAKYGFKYNKAEEDCPSVSGNSAFTKILQKYSLPTNLGFFGDGCSNTSRYPVCIATKSPARAIGFMTQDAVKVFSGSYEFVAQLESGDGNYNSEPETLTNPADLSGLAKVPALILCSNGDGICGTENSRELFLQGRKHGAPWCLLIRNGQGHCTFSKEESAFMLQWMGAIFNLRMTSASPSGPDGQFVFSDLVVESGWLGSFTYSLRTAGVSHGPNQQAVVQSAAISEYSTFSGDKSKAVWLPNRALAEKWASLMTGQAITAPGVILSKPAGLDSVVFSSLEESTTIKLNASAVNGAVISAVDFYYTNNRDYIKIGTDASAPFSIDWHFEPYASKAPGGWENLNIYCKALSNGDTLGSAWVPLRAKMPLASSSAQPFVRASQHRGALTPVVSKAAAPGTFVVRFPANASVESLQIFSLEGRELAHPQRQGDGSFILALPSRASGVVLLRATTSEGLFSSIYVAQP
jgi:hypothetical protein